MEYIAKGKYIKGSSRKARIPARVVKGMLAIEALDVLKYSSKSMALPVSKVIKSAMHNAIHNYGEQQELLYIDQVRIDKAPGLRRYKIRAKGSSAPVRKPYSHIIVVLKSLNEITQSKQNVSSTKEVDVKEKSNESESVVEKTVSEKPVKKKTVKKVKKVQE